MLKAIIANRYEVMADYARSLLRASRAESRHLKTEGCTTRQVADMRIASRLLQRGEAQDSTGRT